MTNYKEVFKRRKKMQILIPIIAAAGAMALYIINLKIIAVAIIIGVVIFSRLNWRCPKCNQYLGRGSNPKHCSNCGEELQ